MISIAMTTYNGEKFLREQIESIISQTFTDWELVVCDDCSKDSSWFILEKYRQLDSRIKIYKNETNLGFKKNFEKAISLCTGEYIALSDQDDIWLPNHLSLLLSLLGDRSLACGNALLIDAEGQSLEKKLNEVDKLYIFDSNKYIFKNFFERNALQGASMLMKRSFTTSCLPIPESIAYHDAWLAFCACLENGIEYSFDVITKYRQHGNNVSYQNHNKIQKSIISQIKLYLNYLFYGIPTDRFSYSEELCKKYGTGNENFAVIYNFFNHRLLKKIDYSDIKMLWDNYEYINTEHGHKGFVIKLISWLKWRRNV